MNRIIYQLITTVHWPRLSSLARKKDPDALPIPSRPNLGKYESEPDQSRPNLGKYESEPDQSRPNLGKYESEPDQSRPNLGNLESKPNHPHPKVRKDRSLLCLANEDLAVRNEEGISVFV
jgi:hypothetical protein